MRATRRRYLAAVATGTLLTGTAQAAEDSLQPYREAYADHITVTFDKPTLQQFQPALDLQGVNVRPTAVYAWTTSSPEFDYDVHTFVYYYQTQYGASSADSHKDDREIAQVYVDPQTDEVREAVYSAGHWRAFRNTQPNTHVPDDGSGEHVQLEAEDTYHHHLGTTTVGTTSVDIEPLGTPEKLFESSNDRTQYEAWLENGLAGTLRPGAWINGDIMRYRDSYWAETSSTRRDRWYAAIWSDLAGTLPAIILPSEFENTEYNR